jgi:two-component system, OmpR family, phosphate regulon response regulator PhoB
VRSSPRILIVEDSHSVAEILTCALEQEGCSTVLARSGQQAVELARRLRPDLIALDVSQECLNGADVVAALRRDPATRDTPIIAVSARDADLESALWPQVTRVFGDPFYPAEVAAAVMQTLAEIKASTTARPAARH